MPGIWDAIVEGQALGGNQTRQALAMALSVEEMRRRGMMDQLNLDIGHERLSNMRRGSGWAEEDRAAELDAQARSLVQEQAAQQYLAKAAAGQGMFRQVDPATGLETDDGEAFGEFMQLPPRLQQDRLRAHEDIAAQERKFEAEKEMKELDRGIKREKLRGLITWLRGDGQNVVPKDQADALIKQKTAELALESAGIGGSLPLSMFSGGGGGDEGQMTQDLMTALPGLSEKRAGSLVRLRQNKMPVGLPAATLSGEERPPAAVAARKIAAARLEREQAEAALKKATDDAETAGKPVEPAALGALKLGVGEARRREFAALRGETYRADVPRIVGPEDPEFDPSQSAKGWVHIRDARGTLWLTTPERASELSRAAKASAKPANTRPPASFLPPAEDAPMGLEEEPGHEEPDAEPDADADDQNVSDEFLEAAMQRLGDGASNAEIEALARRLQRSSKGGQP